MANVTTHLRVLIVLSVYILLRVLAVRTDCTHPFMGVNCTDCMHPYKGVNCSKNITDHKEFGTEYIILISFLLLIIILCIVFVACYIKHKKYTELSTDAVSLNRDCIYQ